MSEAITILNQPKPSIDNNQGLPTPTSLGRYSNQSRILNHSIEELERSELISAAAATSNSSTSTLNPYQNDFRWRRSSSVEDNNNVNESVGLFGELDYEMELSLSEERDQIEIGSRNSSSGGINRVSNDNEIERDSLHYSGRPQRSTPAFYTNPDSNRRRSRFRHSTSSPPTGSSTDTSQDLPYRIPTPSSFKRTFESAETTPQSETSTFTSTSPVASGSGSDPFSVFTRNTLSTARPTSSNSSATNWRNSMMDSQRVSIGRGSILSRRGFTDPEEDVLNIRMSGDSSNQDIPISGEAITTTPSTGRFKRRRPLDSPPAINDNHSSTASTSSITPPTGLRNRARSFSIDPLLTTIRNLTTSNNNNALISPPISPSSINPSVGSPTRRRRISLNSLNCIFPQSNTSTTPVPTINSNSGTSNSRLGSFRRATETSRVELNPIDFGTSNTSTFETPSQFSNRSSIYDRSLPNNRHSIYTDRRLEIQPERNQIQTRADEVLSNANHRLEVAESTLQNAIRVIQADQAQSSNVSRNQVDQEEESEETTLRRTVDFLERVRSPRERAGSEEESNRDRESELRMFPTTRNLPLPIRSNEVPPIIGFRIGNRSGSSSPARSSLSTSLAANYRSPPIESEALPSSSTSSTSRGQRLLASLRDTTSSTLPAFTATNRRRPALSRGISTYSPPEVSRGQHRIDQSQIELEVWNEQLELVRAEELRIRMEEARTAAGIMNGTSVRAAREGFLWGEVPSTNNEGVNTRTTSHIGSRMRGPTETSNELRRRRFEGYLESEINYSRNELGSRNDSETPYSRFTTPTPFTRTNNLSPRDDIMGFSDRPRGVIPGGDSSRSNSPSPTRNSQTETLQTRFPPARIVNLRPPRSLFDPPVGLEVELPGLVPIGNNDTNTQASRFVATRAESNDNNLLRRRRPTSEYINSSGTNNPINSINSNIQAATAAGQEVGERLNRLERLASLRRERAAVRDLYEGGNTNDLADDVPESPPPRLAYRGGIEGNGRGLENRQMNRRRSFSELFRNFRGGLTGGGRVAAFLDTDFGFFGGLNSHSAALDPRNYLDDDDFDTSYESLLRLSERLGDVKPKSSGISPEKMLNFKTFNYKDWPTPRRNSVNTSSPTIPVASTSASVMMNEDSILPLLARRGLEKEEKCAICLTEYEEVDEILMGSCAHGFHSECLLAWMKSNSSCPVCRANHA